MTKVISQLKANDISQDTVGYEILIEVKWLMTGKHANMLSQRFKVLIDRTRTFTNVPFILRYEMVILYKRFMAGFHIYVERLLQRFKVRSDRTASFTNVSYITRGCRRFITIIRIRSNKGSWSLGLYTKVAQKRPRDLGLQRLNLS